MKLTMTLLLALCSGLCAAAQQDSTLVVFWNVENFYDWKDGGASDSDRDFSSGGSRHWTSRRFYEKCNGIAKILLLIGDHCGRMPDAVGLAEVENAFVLRQLLASTLLDKLGYRYLHYDSPDRRGIDCALLYRPASLSLVRSYPVRLSDSLRTRDILVAEFEGLDILVNHHPSKVGKGSSEKRTLALDRLDSVTDSLSEAGHVAILAIGDFNDDIWGGDSPGTIKYHGRWEKIDGHLARGLKVGEEVFNSPFLSTIDRSWGGEKPNRTYIGPRYNGGLSDHYPILIWVSQSCKEQDN